jgi:hypothetical protein
MDLRKIEKWMQIQVKEVIEELCDDWEGFANQVNLVEHKSRDGFIAHTDGGVSGLFFIDENGLVGSGNITFLPEKAWASIEKIRESCFEDIRFDFYEAYSDDLSQFKLEDIDYHMLYENNMPILAEKLDELETYYHEDSTVMFDIEAYLYEPYNTRNPNKEEYTCYMYGLINWEPPYHRIGKFPELQWDGLEHEFTFKDFKEFKRKFLKNLKQVKEELDK